MSYLLSIKLTALNGATVHSDIIDGVPKKSITIPVEENYMYEDDRGHLYLRVQMANANANKYNASHRLVLEVPLDLYRKFKREGDRRKIVYLGSAWVLRGAKFDRSPERQKGNIDEILRD